MKGEFKMKAVLNVDGKQLEVTNIYYVNGEVKSVQVHLGNHLYETYEHHDSLFSNDATKLVDFSKSLEFPRVKELIEDEQNKLIEHLDEFIKQENEELTNIAIEAMEGRTDLPFNNYLSEKQQEYKLAQQRIFGIIDAIEEVKAFLEGWYSDDKTTAAVETEKHHQSIE